MVRMPETSLLGVLKEASFDGGLVLNPSLVSYCTDARVSYKIKDVDSIVPLDRIYFVEEVDKERLEEIVKDGELANEVKQKEIQDKLKGKKDEKL